MGADSRSATAALATYAAGQHDRDLDTLAELSGPSAVADLARSRAVAVLGTDDVEAADWSRVLLLRDARRTGTIAPEDARRLLAAELLTGKRSDIGREVEALLADGGTS
ncbi:hypothetical protein ASH02_05845 [Nocardioides sp. Soil796]|nr:hypothetical protein ASH02_05845 [Nocardioides sp. Soil796]